MKVITSSENPIVKAIRQLQNRSGRRLRGRLVIEGVKLASEALSCGIEIDRAVLAVPFAASGTGRGLIARMEKASIPWVATPDRLFRRLSSLESPEGILLLGRRELRSIESLEGDLVLVIVGAQDPGNIGAMARVAEATGASGLVRCRGSADPYQPKALRASMGSLLRMPVFEGGEPEATLRLLEQKGLCLVACTPRHGTDYLKVNLRRPVAILMGNESSGLPRRLLDLCEVRISVPMRERVESLNVAVVAGLVLYEAARQRGTFEP